MGDSDEILKRMDMAMKRLIVDTLSNIAYGSSTLAPTIMQTDGYLGAGFSFLRASGLGTASPRYFDKGRLIHKGLWASREWMTSMRLHVKLQLQSRFVSSRKDADAQAPPLHINYEYNAHLCHKFGRGCDRLRHLSVTEL